MITSAGTVLQTPETLYDKNWDSNWALALSCGIFQGCLEQHDDDALVICLCWIVLAYSVCLMLLSDHFLFSYISTRIILNARACLCKIYVLDFSVKLQKHNE